MKLVCIATGPGGEELAIGRIYTARGVCQRHGETSGVFVNEAKPSPGWCCFLRELFRPVVKDQTSAEVEKLKRLLKTKVMT